MEAMAMLAVGAAVLLGLCALLYYYSAAGPRCRNAVSLRGKTVLITGGNVGIGKATAVDLARRGARVILACRNKARGESTVCDIRRESGNSEVILMILDLANLNSVRAFAQSFLKSEPRLDILINNAGGNAGIGKATAVDLARRGARVILACRNKARGESAVCDIRRESGNSEVILMILDLANLNSVRAFAQSFLKSEPRLDILINNAGVLQDGQTIDGFDLDFQINHLSHFLLTHLLLDRLKRCAPSQIIIVSSSSHSYGKIDFQTIHKPAEGMWHAFQSYSNSKLANILHARELTNRLEGTNVTCYAVHPGGVRTEIGYASPSWLFRLVWYLSVFKRNCDTGAQTSIYCATEEGIERLSGQYFADCQPKVPCPQARDDQLAKKLWEFSERLLGLTT